MLALSNLRVGEFGRILGFRGSGDKGYRQKLLAMGLTPNTLFEVIRRAPLGDPIQIRVRDFYLILQQDEVAQLEIERE
ncbi:FeoA family protein [Coxiella endosymbiont of Amblyomma nuttalli]|uniref:FeoA family protein n=1 Tax=Coxiella endosymbiont of Amblyomma nuttalli TaxID=2749996 RepID=UPI001BABC546|nr:FeoA family protein [Coxiella endosymbiont of Amblyomma nuttalli]QTS84177.1 Ferrous iron transport protein A [Coxiella endosymbiont of Amblyomma nuttalli]